MMPSIGRVPLDGDRWSVRMRNRSSASASFFVEGPQVPGDALAKALRMPFSDTTSISAPIASASSP